MFLEHCVIIKLSINGNTIKLSLIIREKNNCIFIEIGEMYDARDYRNSTKNLGIFRNFFSTYV